MIKVENIYIKYHNNDYVIKDLSLTVPRGAIFGFIGSNGSGKSTTIKSILGLLKPTKGSISVLGIENPSNNAEIRSKIGYLIEKPNFYKNLTTYENLVMLKFFYGFDKSRIKEVLELFGLWEERNQLYSSFSTGMKQRLGIAKSFLSNPELVILDEPLNGLDPSWIIEVRNVLKRINNQYGTTIFLSSHLLSEMEKVVTHIGILKEGGIVYQGKISDFINKKDRSIAIRYNSTVSFSFVDMVGFKFISNDNNIAKFHIEKDAVYNELFNYFINNNLVITNISINEESLETAVTKIYNL